MEKENKKFQESLDFVSKHYRSDAFNTEQAARNLNIPTYRTMKIRRRWLTVAASVAVILTAAAAAYLMSPSEPGEPLDRTETQTQVEKASSETFPETAMLEFDNAPLSEIVSEIETVYGVKITNLPADTSERLTLSQSGTAEELIETLNDLLSSKMQIEKK